MKVTITAAGTYTTVIGLKDANGKFHTKRFTAKTKKAVLQKALDYQSAHTIYLESRAFADCMARVIDEKEKVLSPSTIRAYRGMQRTLEAEYRRFVETPIEHITPALLQTFANDMGRSHRAKTVRNYLGLISIVMSAEGFRILPVTVKRDKRMFSPDVPDAETVSQVADAVKGTRLEVPFALACMGLRRGEICGILPSALKGNRLHICRTLVMADGNYVEEKSTKTEASDRYVVIPERIADLIREQGYAWKRSPSALSECFPRFLESHGLPRFRLHDCRHFFASYCHDVLKLSDAQIMKLGGWSTDHVMKRVYITAITDSTKEVEGVFTDLLGQKEK